jgi:hypothetical protein
VGSGREAHGKENPRTFYAVGLRTEPAPLVRGSSRRITIMRLRPANIRVINRRNSRLDRDLRCLTGGGELLPSSHRDCQPLDSDVLANNETSVIDEICDQRAIRMLVDIWTEFPVITTCRKSGLLDGMDRESTLEH